MKHKDVILAYADGETIEVFSNGHWQNIAKPSFYQCDEYRVKPKIKRYLVLCLHHYSKTLSVSKEFYASKEEFEAITKDTFLQLLTDGPCIDQAYTLVPHVHRKYIIEYVNGATIQIKIDKNGDTWEDIWKDFNDPNNCMPALDKDAPLRIKPKVFYYRALYTRKSDTDEVFYVTNDYYSSEKDFNLSFTGSDCVFVQLLESLPE